MAYVKKGRILKHGLYYHPLYRVWIKIKDRLYNSNHEAYHLYGGNGVVMCDEWKDNPKSFIEWALENGWEKGLHIDKDKIPHELGIPAKIYSPEMCSILTPKENRRYNKDALWIEYNGQRKILFDWADELGIDYATLHHRLYDFGYTVEDAFTLPRTGQRKKVYEHNGVSKTIKEWCAYLEIGQAAFFKRLKNAKLTKDQIFTEKNTKRWL